MRGGETASELATWLGQFVRDPSFLAAYPYYTWVLSELTPVHDASVPLMGLSLHPVQGRGARYFLHVNVSEVLKEPQYLRGLLLHEVHHLVLGHISHPKFFGLDQPDLLQLAQEMSANEYISEPLPSPIVWQQFEALGIRANQSTIERYEKLCQARAQGREPKPARDTQQVDEHTWRDQLAPTPAGLTETRHVVSRARDQGDEDARRSQADRREGGRMAGRTPDQLLLQLGDSQRAPEQLVPWRAALRMFAAATRAPKPTWSRPARRFPQRVGEVPGRAYQHRPSLRPVLLVAIDTSMSMGERELAEIARQLVPISELARIWIAECDTEVTRTYPFAGALSEVHGRGGTDLRPVFDDAFLRSRAVDGVVYFTDGHGPAPEHPPSVPVLWALTDAQDFACPWGQRVSLDFAKSSQKPPARAKKPSAP